MDSIYRRKVLNNGLTDTLNKFDGSKYNITLLVNWCK